MQFYVLSVDFCRFVRSKSRGLLSYCLYNLRGKGVLALRVHKIYTTCSLPVISHLDWARVVGAPATEIGKIAH